MSGAIRVRDLDKGWGDRRILRGLDLQVAPGERVGLVGPNGSGKTTLLRCLAGQDTPDHGSVELTGRVGYLAQVPALEGRTVGEAMESALDWHRDLLARWQAAVDTGDLETAGSLQADLDQHGWTLGHRVQEVLQRLGAPPQDAALDRLSGGELRRVALARVLLGRPDVLLLDEPTNHLDADAAEWLQGFLAGWRGTLVLVTHDRYLNEAVAERIVELEDGEAVSYEGSYGDYLVARLERRAALERAEHARLALLAREAAWAARSPAARTSKCGARLKRLQELEAARPLIRAGSFSMDLSTGEKLGPVLLDVDRLRVERGGRRLLSGATFTVGPGERLGVLGPNGCGKSTLLRVLAGREEPDGGSVRRAPRARPALFDQERTGLDPRDTVFQAAGGGNSHVRIGERHVHVASFLDRFLFPSEAHDQRVSALSGGERARLLLARLLLQGANLLLLDEPTNDLDLQTLRVLEEALLSVDGAALVVTHDRAFLDRVCTGVLAFGPGGRLDRFADRAQLQAARRAEAVVEEAPRPAAPPPRKKAEEGPRRLGFKEQRELADLPARIEALEEEQAELGQRLADPGTYREGADVAAITARFEAVQAEIEAAYARWEALEARR